jgi:CheY-like chemotaxis protein
MAEYQIDSRPVALVVEDEALVRMYASEILEERGFNVLQAANAEGALKVMEAEPHVRLLRVIIRSTVQASASTTGLSPAQRGAIFSPLTAPLNTQGQSPKPSRASRPGMNML